MKSLLARWLFAVTLLCIRIFSYRIAMRHNKTDRDCRYRSPLEIVSTQFGKYYPPLRIGQYFPNIGQTISNSDLNISHYPYNSALQHVTHPSILDDEAPEISMSCKLQQDAIVTLFKYNSHQNYDVLMFQLAVNRNFPP